MVEQTLVTFAFTDITVKIIEFIYTFLLCLARAIDNGYRICFLRKRTEKAGKRGGNSLPVLHDCHCQHL